MVVFDTTFLRLLLRPNADPPHHPETADPVTRCRERIEYLIELLEKEKQTILIPTPALAELLVKEENFGVSHLEFIDKTAAFRIADFDRRAAIEVASMTRAVLGKTRSATAPMDAKAKVKFDRQIIAIAKVNATTVIYSDDKRLRKFARKVGLTAIGVHDLPLKPDPPQRELALANKPE
jgi:predicted nucleic acid-binding protein